MKICFFTNTFAPHVGGVARSVQTFLEEYRAMRHRVLVVAPEFPGGGAPWRIERSVERVPAIQNFNGSDFSVRLPLGSALSDRLARFKTDIVHTHHPFLLGDSALRLAANRAVPTVFTHHTLYEKYTHYVPFDSTRMQDFVIELSTRFANRCQGVIAPSESIADLIKSRGVVTPIRVVPTGIDIKAQSKGDGRALRKRLGIEPGAVVLGHVGRLAAEKNLDFLADATARCLKRNRKAHLIIVGSGPAQGAMEKTLRDAGAGMRVHFLGTLSGRKLHDAYAAMDIFAFASQSETQGLVVAEAMAAGLPVVAIDATGVREVVRERANGRLLPAEASRESFARALAQAVKDDRLRAAWSREARRTAARFDRRATAKSAIDFYAEIIASHRAASPPEGLEGQWNTLLDRLAIEAQLASDKIGSIARALFTETPPAQTAAAAG